MNRLTVEDIVEIHRKGISQWGGDSSYRPETLANVGGALDNAFQAALYASSHSDTDEPDVLVYASAILTYLARAQHFVDGNKRAAWGGCVRALERNGYYVRASTNEILSLIDDLIIARRNVEAVADTLAQWLEVIE